MTVVPSDRMPLTAERNNRRRSGLLKATTALALLVCLGLCVTEARAQGIGLPGLDPSQEATAADENMLLNADELVYNRDEDSISARGSVQIYYDGRTLFADSVTMYRKTGRFVARGNVQLEERDGNIVYTDEAELADDFAEGFLTALRVQTVFETRFAAESAERTEGNKTVFSKGVYNACRTCITEGRKRPTWQVKAGKIIHNQKEKIVSYRHARIEFLGLPVFYSPYFFHPDPTLRRKTGFLLPSFVQSDNIGYGVRLPFFINVAPNMDVTLAATPLTEQGVLLDGVWRHKTRKGLYQVALSGIRQNNPQKFTTFSGNTRFRGSVSTTGSFTINNIWTWGFTATAATDPSFLADYKAHRSLSASAESNIFLNGQNDRNYFRVESGGSLILQEEGNTQFTNNLQQRQPIIHPVLDYAVVFDNPVAGGELSFGANLTALSRGFTDRDSFGRILGAEGNFLRSSTNVQWRRQFVDPIGQVFTPFAYMRADGFILNNQTPNSTTSFTDGTAATLTTNEFAARVTPAVGAEYSYPLISSHSWGNQIIEPMGQFIARPGEQRVGDLPNEDAQSLIFDDSLLFDLDKFSGFDRAEGGTRANIGVRYSLQLNNGVNLSTLFGRSFQIAGRNSFTSTDLVKTAAGSGLDSSSSDYVSRVYLDTAAGLQFGARARFDRKDLELNRAEIQGVGRLGPALGSLTYAFVNTDVAAGIPEDLTEIQGSGSLRISRAFRTFGSIRYDIGNKAIVRNALGMGYDFDDFSLSLAFSEDRSRNDSELTNRTFYLRFGLRTLGASTLSQSVLPQGQ